MLDRKPLPPLASILANLIAPRPAPSQTARDRIEWEQLAFRRKFGRPN